MKGFTAALSDHELRTADVEPPISLSHIVRTIRAYSGMIILSVAGVAALYTIIAAGLYLWVPSYRVTSQNFRLDFEGANRGNYPNGMKFSTGEIVSTPILMKVFQENQLQRFIAPRDFMQSIFVLESNPEYERLAGEYHARLADPKLTPIDRDRIQKEWEERSASLGKSDHSITYVRTDQTRVIPEVIVRKVLTDILTNWANFVIREQHVLAYDMSIISPDVVTDAPGTDDPLVATQIIRAKAMRALKNIEDLQLLPAAKLIRTSKDARSLADIHAQLEDLVRFHLEPLMARIHDAGIAGSSSDTIRLIEAQLAYDQRQLAAQEERSEVVRQAIIAYAGEQVVSSGTRTSLEEPTGGRTSTLPEAQQMVPQLSDSFIDRLVKLAMMANDIPYRQGLIESYRETAMDVIPLQQAVVYDETLLEMVRSRPRGSSATDVRALNAEIEKARRETRALIVQINEIYRKVSENLNPSTHLYTITQSPVTRIQRGVSVKRLALIGFVLCAATLAVTILLSLLHNRVREEEEVEHHHAERLHA